MTTDETTYEVRVSGYMSNHYSKWGSNGMFFDTYAEAEEKAKNFVKGKKGFGACIIKHSKSMVTTF